VLKSSEDIPRLFGWYNLIGYVAQAGGAMSAGAVISYCIGLGYSDVSSYRLCVVAYSFFAIVMIFLYCGLSHDIEPLHTRDYNVPRNWFGKFGLQHDESRRIVAKLSALFVIDAFAGGFVMQTIIVYWFHQEYNMDINLLGTMMMGANILAGCSALLATPLVKKIGAINTMVFTHFPSNIFLLAVPLMPTMWSAVVMLLIRFSISQMDVPARQSYVAVSVAPEERSAAGGITNIVRSIGVALAPLATGTLLSDKGSILFLFPFIISGGLKCLYDVMLFYAFKSAESSGNKYTSLPTSEPKPSAAQQAANKSVQEDENLDEDDLDIKGSQPGNKANTKGSIN